MWGRRESRLGVRAGRCTIEEAMVKASVPAGPRHVHRRA